MCRLHPSITRRLHHICRAVMSVPPEVRTAILEYVTEQQTETEQARWALQQTQARILGESREQMEAEGWPERGQTAKGR